LRPDLAFLDVEMPECDGFDVLEMLGVDRPAAIVFVTAHATYAIRAFDAGALDYLLKPFDDERFARALQRAKDRLREVVPRHVEQFAIKTATGIEFLRVSEIDWIEAADYYSRLHVSARTQLLRRSMAELERDLDPTAFCRIHRSTIVRLDAVRGLELSEDGEHDIVLNDGTRLRCSRRYRKLLQSRLPARPSKNR
jgi:two-component system LytT family response regulator